MKNGIKKSRIAVVIPTLNEGSNIRNLLDNLIKLPWNLSIIIVDGGSLDQTKPSVISHPNYGESISLITQKTPAEGIGPAYLEGFQIALDSGVKRIIQMDADGSHAYGEIPSLLKVNKDLVIGSRYIQGGRIESWPISRLLLSRISNLAVRLLLSPRVRDATSGFRCMSIDLVKEILSQTSSPKGFAFQVSNTILAIKEGFSIEEVPIRFTNRKLGTSKISLRNITEALLWLIKAKVSGIAKKP